MSKFNHQDLFNIINQSHINPYGKHDAKTVKQLTKAYEIIKNCLDHADNQLIEDALKQADEENNMVAYETISSITLNLIHQLRFIQEDIQYVSTLFIVPYFTAPDDPSYQGTQTIHYPPPEQIEKIFQHHFVQQGLIHHEHQLHLPAIKIDATTAYNLDFSDWLTVHESSLHKSLIPEDDEYRHTELNLSISSQGDLSFFPLIIIYEEKDYLPIPAICQTDVDTLPFEQAVENIEKEVSLLSQKGQWALGIPSHCQNALDFGLEIEQDFSLDQFFKSIVQREDINLIIFPLEEGDIGLMTYNIETNSVEDALELYYYSSDPDEFIDHLLQQIDFYDIARTFVFQESIGIYSIDDANALEKFDLEEAAEHQPVIVLQPQASSKKTLH